MARIRTIKPEAFESEDLASVDVTAMVTFFGLLTQADDHGRFRDHPAIIAGRLWALRADHNPADVARDLDQLMRRRPHLPLHRMRRRPVPALRDLGEAPEDRPRLGVAATALPRAPEPRQVQRVRRGLVPGLLRSGHDGGTDHSRRALRSPPARLDEHSTNPRSHHFAGFGALCGPRGLPRRQQQRSEVDSTGAPAGSARKP